MKNNLYLICLIVLTLFIFSFTSCNNSDAVSGNGKVIRKEITIKGFSKLEIGGPYFVFVKQGANPQMVIECDENILELIDAEVKNNELKISSKKSLLSNKGIYIYLTVTNLEQIESSGNTRINGTDKLNFDKLKIDLSGNSIFTMNVNCVELGIECSGNSKLSLSGIVPEADIEASGSSDVNTNDMIIEKLKVETSGDAHALVNVFTKLEIKASGSSKVEYKSVSMLEVIQNVSGTATVNKIY